MTDGRFARTGLVHNMAAMGGNMNRPEQFNYRCGKLLVARYGRFAIGLGRRRSKLSLRRWRPVHCPDFSAEYGERAHLQIDGRAVTLAKRFGLSGHALFRAVAHYAEDRQGGHRTIKHAKHGRSRRAS